MAIAYQIMICAAIASSSCQTATFLACIVVARTFDLSRQALVPRGSIPGLSPKQKSVDKQPDNKQPGIERPTESPSRSELRFSHKSQETSPSNDAEPLLRIIDLAVESANLTAPLLEIHGGDRVGIRGRSGIGER